MLKEISPLCGYYGNSMVIAVMTIKLIFNFQKRKG